MQNLISFKRRGGSTSSHPTSPPLIPTIPELVEPPNPILSAGRTSQASSTSPTTPVSPSSNKQEEFSYRNPSSPTGKTSLTSSDIASPPPLPPITDSYLYSPEGSTVQSVQSGPYLDPPDEFSMDLTPQAQPSPSHPHPSQNGRPDIKHHQVNLHTAMSDPQVHDLSLADNREALDHVVLLANTNGNSNNSNNYRVYTVSRGYNSISTGIANRAPIGTGMGLKESHFPSEASTLSHSDNIRSSLESGFDADNELENTPAWYVSPDSSPKSRRNFHHQRTLGPKVVLSKETYPYSTTCVPAQQQEANYSALSGGSQKSRENSISEEYEQNPLHANRRGSIPSDTPHTKYSSTQQQSVRFTQMHKVSRSFDATEVFGTRADGRRSDGPFGSGDMLHSRTPGAPMSPVVQVVRDSQMKTKRVPVRDGGGNPAISHIRSKSQPEEVLNVVPMLAQPHSHTHSYSQPHTHPSQSSSQSPRVCAISPHTSHLSHHHHRHHHHQNEKNLLYQQRKLVMSDESIFQSAYPGHRGVSNQKGQSASNTSKGQSSGSRKVRHQSEFHAHSYQHSPQLKAPHGLESYYISDDSQLSGRGTPETTPTLGNKGKWVSGNDSGFDSMQRSHQPPMDHSGTYVSCVCV